MPHEHEGIPSPIITERSMSVVKFEELSAHLRGLSEELAAERRARLDEEKRGISVLSLRVPFLMVFLIVGPLVGAGIAGGMFVKSTRGHVANTYIHADEHEALARGGVAYERDIDDKVQSAISDQAKNERSALRLMLKERPLTCSAPHGKAKMQDCKFGDQPEWNR